MIPLRLTTSPLTATFSNSALTRVCFFASRYRRSGYGIKVDRPAQIGTLVAPTDGTSS